MIEAWSRQGSLRAIGGRAVLVVDGLLFEQADLAELAQLSPGQLALLSMPDGLPADPLPLEAFRQGHEATFGPSTLPPRMSSTPWFGWCRDGGDRLLPRLIRYIEERRRNQDRWTRAWWGSTGP